MRRRASLKFRPGLGRLEEKRLPSAAPLVDFAAGTGAGAAALHTSPLQFTLSRITNPGPFNARLTPPFGHVLVQANAPVPGVVYNVLSISVRNSTRQTFDASSGLAVKITGQSRSFPILTGSEQWKPGQVFVFYNLTKQYYPLHPVTSAGYRLNFANGVAIPGPSGIFLRVKYNPAKFGAVLDQIVTHGPGAKGHQLGLPDTAIWEFFSAKTDIVPL